MMKGYGGGELYQGGPKDVHVPGAKGDQSLNESMKAQTSLSEVTPDMARGFKRQMPTSPGENADLAAVNYTKPGAHMM